MGGDPRDVGPQQARHGVDRGSLDTRDIEDQMVGCEVRAKIGKGCVERGDGDGWDDEIAVPGELGQ